MIRLKRFEIRARTGQVLLEECFLEVPAERNLFVVGESGSGKTSLLMALAGVSSHRVSGESWLKDRPLIPLPGIPKPGTEGGRVLLAVQDARQAFTPYRRLSGQLADGTRAASEGQADLVSILGVLGLELGEALHRFPHQLSQGMLKRVLVAGVLASGADLCLFDEPTAGVDPSRRWAVLDIICRKSVRFVIATHDIRLAASCPGDHLLVLKQGRSVESGPVGEVLKRPTDPYTAALLETVSE